MNESRVDYAQWSKKQNHGHDFWEPRRHKAAAWSSHPMCSYSIQLLRSLHTTFVQIVEAYKVLHGSRCCITAGAFGEIVCTWNWTSINTLTRCPSKCNGVRIYIKQTHRVSFLFLSPLPSTEWLSACYVFSAQSSHWLALFTPKALKEHFRAATRTFTQVNQREIIVQHGRNVSAIKNSYRYSSEPLA